MNRHKLSLLIAGVAALAVIAGGWFLGVQPQIASAASSRDQRATIESTNASVQAELTRLQTRFEKLDDMKATLADLSASVPDSANTPSFITALNGMASMDSVAITSITVGDPLAYTPPETASTASTSPAGATASPSATATASPSATPNAAPTPTAPEAKTNASITSANFTAIPVTVAIEGSYDQALAFTGSAQSGKRLFLVSSLAATSSDSGDTGSTTVVSDTPGAQNWSLSGFIYVLDTDTAAAPAATSTTTNG